MFTRLNWLVVCTDKPLGVHILANNEMIIAVITSRTTPITGTTIFVVAATAFVVTLINLFGALTIFVVVPVKGGSGSLEVR